MRKDSIRSLVVATAAVAFAGALALLAPSSAGAAPNNAMKDLMKSMGPLAAGEDAKPLAPLLARAKSMKPADPSFDGWDAIAEAGRVAAEKGDMTGAKASCKGCHNKFRDSYKTKFGSKAP